MKSKRRISTFFKFSLIKLILSVLFIFCAFFFEPYFLGAYSYSPISDLICLPFVLSIEFIGLFALILIIPYSYLIACSIIALFNIIKNRKWLLISITLILLLLLGFDEPFVNKIFNKPDFSCNLDTDCALKYINPQEIGCGPHRCANKEWNYYNSIINNVFASCRATQYVCSCINNTCVAKDLLKE